MEKLWLEAYLIIIKNSSPYNPEKFVNKAKNDLVLLLVCDDKETSAWRAYSDPV